MLSVILYGRNDSHGYNLHKRAAISLNAIAHLLTDPDDEILFVDYNTPDDLPSFPEAIADTLTPKAVQHLKVLRVRSDIHQARFAARTHLHALEPIARNVAIRRSNPANRWVLSTNTDMIFCPRTAEASLTSIFGGLADGFYHLPRFELPEALWETLDRMDGPGLIAAARDWGQRFHLNEIVRSAGDHLFDGPGDFQLFLREDLYAIGGFHEEMIRGWHLDANVARRMHKLRSEVRSALDHLVGYHCDHTRQASAYHKGDRVENDPVRFVDDVASADVPEQMHSWGLPDVEIETFRIGQASGARYLKALHAAVPKGGEGFLESAYVPDAYGRLSYDADHVLPYLLDLVSCIPQQSRVAYVGARCDLFEGFARGWNAMGGVSPVMVPDIAPWLATAAGPSQVLPVESWIETADLFVFEIGAEEARFQTELSARESARLWAVDHAFKRATAADFARQDQGGAPRRAFVVNGIHNFFEPHVFRAISASLTPFSTRIRHGYITDRSRGRLAAASPAQKAVAKALNALEPLSAGEMKRLRDIGNDLDLRRPNLAAWVLAGKVGAELVALSRADQDWLAQGRRAETFEAVNARRPSRQPEAAGILAADAGRGAASRLARLEDWDDPAWVALAGQLYGTVEHANLFTRERWMWERVSLTANLAADLPPEHGGAVLLAGRLPEAHAFALAQLGYEVDIADPQSLAEDRPKAIDWRARYAKDGWVTRLPLGLVDDRAAAIANGFRYDAVLIVENGIFDLGRNRVADILRGASALLRPGGHLGFSAVCQVLAADKRVMERALCSWQVRGGALGKALDEHTELALVGSIDDRMTPRSFDRLNAPDSPCPAPALVQDDAPHSQTVGVFALRRRDQATGDWGPMTALLKSTQSATQAQPIESAATPFTFADLEDLPPSAGGPARFGPLMEAAVIAKDGVRRTPRGLVVTPEGQRMTALHLDIGQLDPGGYELVLELFLPPTARPGAVAAFGIVSAGKIVAQHLADGAPTGPRRVDFYFELDQAAAAQGLRLAVSALGGDFDILDMNLR